MKEPILQWRCGYCSRHWGTKEEAEACAVRPDKILQKDDVLDWSEYRYGLVKDVHEETDWPGFNADRTEDYCIATGFNIKDMFVPGVKAACWAGRICGGPERHHRLLMKQGVIDRLVKDLEKRLKAAKRLQVAVTKMWEKRSKDSAEQEASTDICGS